MSGVCAGSPVGWGTQQLRRVGGGARAVTGRISGPLLSSWVGDGCLGPRPPSPHLSDAEGRPCTPHGNPVCTPCCGTSSESKDSAPHTDTLTRETHRHTSRALTQ